MKKLIKILAIFVLCFSVPAQAQFLNKLKEKAQKTLNKVDETAKSVDKVTGSKTSSKIPNSTSDISNSFSGGSITFSKTRGGATEKNFSVNDNLYATVNLEEPLINYLKEEGEENEPFKMIPVSLIYVIDGAARGEFTSVKIPKEDYTKKTLILDILPAKGDAKSQYLNGGKYKSAIARPLSAFDALSYTEMPYGTQRFDFSFGINSEHKGSFNFTVKNKAEQKIIAKRAQEGQDAMSDAIAQETTLPAEFQKQGKFSDPQLSLANIRKMVSYPEMTILKLVIDASGGNDYHINKNELDIPTMKVTNKPVWLAYKQDGKCFYMKRYFTRQYEGSGKYGPLEVATTTASIVPIACENIK